MVFADNFKQLIQSKLIIISVLCCIAFPKANFEPASITQMPSVEQEMNFEGIFSEYSRFLTSEVEADVRSRLLLKNKQLSLDEQKRFDNDLTTVRFGYQAVYKILSKVDSAFDQGKFGVVFGDESFRHLRILCGDQGALDKSIWTKIGRTETCFGRAVLAKMLSTPTTNLALLKSRQKVVKKMLDDQTFFDSVDKLSKNVRSLQDGLIEILANDPSSDFGNILHPTGLPSFSSLNKFDRDLLIAKLNRNVIVNNGIIGVRFLSQATLFFILGLFCYLSYEIAFKDPKDFFNRFIKDIKDIFPNVKSVASCFYKGQFSNLGSELKGLSMSFVNPLSCIGLLSLAVGSPYLVIKSVYNWSVATIKAFRQSGSMRKLFDNYKKMAELVKKLDPEQQKALNLFQISAETLENKINQDLKWLVKNLPKTKTPGGFLKAYKMIYQLRLEMAYVFAAIGQLDAFLSMAKLYKELEAKKNGLCFAKFVDSRIPQIKAQGVWDLSLDADVAVPSNFVLGGDADFHDAILTGPNTAGKSTFMRSVFLNILLAQTFGFGCAQSLQLTLFHGLFSYMNVVDNISKGMSQFYSEAHTVTQALNQINELADAGKPTFFMVDEMFSGTNPEDARSILEAICKSAARIDQSIWIVSTHLPGAAQAIIDKTVGRFGGLKVNNVVQPDGKVVFDHRIVPGTSSTSTAFDVITAVGLKKEIVDDARQIRASLSH